MRAVLLSLLLLSAPVLADSPLRALIAEHEVGPAYIFRNTGRYGPEGTEYEAGDINQQRNLLLTQRLSLEARLGQRHGLILLYAPFALETRAVLPFALNFQGTVFPQGTVVDSRYRFDGYRVSYLYRLMDRERLRWDIGASVQVRNALVDFRAVDGSLYEDESDIGLVGAVKTRLWSQLPSRVWWALEADALATFGLAGSAEGSLYDVALTLGVPLGARGDVDAFARLRLLGGGADVPDRNLYNQALFGFAVLGVRADLVSLVARIPAPHP